jgi:hypothetical protein
MIDKRFSSLSPVSTRKSTSPNDAKVDPTTTKDNLKTDIGNASEARQTGDYDNKSPAAANDVNGQSGGQKKADKLNVPWKIKRSNDELDKVSKEIFSLDKDPIKALQKALLMPKFFNQKKPDAQ